MPSIHGIIVPCLTFFRPDLEIDWEATGRHIDILLDHGVDGIFVLGSTGEAMHLTPEEREEMTRWAVQHVRGRAPVLVGTGHTSTGLAVRFTRAAHEAGAQAAVVVAPYYWSLDDRHLEAYFRAVVAASPLPIILYNFPGVTGRSLPVDLVKTLASECPTVIGLKDTLDSAVHLREVATEVLPERPDFALFNGFDDLLLANLVMGGVGAITSAFNFVPEAAVAVMRAARANDWGAAHAAQRTLHAIGACYRLDTDFIAVAKEATFERGFGPEPCLRPPSLRLPPASQAAVRRILSHAGLPVRGE